MSRSLFIVNSVYHLLTAVNLRRQGSAGEEAHLLLTDVTPGLRERIPSLVETGLFSRVIPAATRELASRFPMNREETAAQCFAQGEALLRWALGEELAASYGQVFFPNFDWLARLLACRLDCPFFWMEDGFSSYVIDFARPDRAAVNRLPQGRLLGEKAQAALLYEPSLAMRGDRIPNRPLPKLSPEDQELKRLLNHVFHYHAPRHLPSFLFLEQSFRAEGIQGNDLDLMRLCQQAVGPGNFGVKPHPRNGDSLPQSLGLSRRVDLDVPWELFLLNEGPDRCAVVTVCSNGALSGRLCLGMDPDTVLLYKLYTGKVLWKENRVLARYLETYRRQLAGRNTYVPETIYEAASVLKYLGGKYGG